jgi:hypothetical protein
MLKPYGTTGHHGESSAMAASQYLWCTACAVRWPRNFIEASCRLAARLHVHMTPRQAKQ